MKKIYQKWPWQWQDSTEWQKFQTRSSRTGLPLPKKTSARSGPMAHQNSPMNTRPKFSKVHPPRDFNSHCARALTFEKGFEALNLCYFFVILFLRKASRHCPCGHLWMLFLNPGAALADTHEWTACWRHRSFATPWSGSNRPWQGTDLGYRACVLGYCACVFVHHHNALAFCNRRWD